MNKNNGLTICRELNNIFQMLKPVWLPSAKYQSAFRMLASNYCLFSSNISLPCKNLIESRRSGTASKIISSSVVLTYSLKKRAHQLVAHHATIDI